MLSFLKMIFDGLTTIPGCIARIEAVGGEALAIPTCTYANQALLIETPGAPLRKLQFLECCMLLLGIFYQIFPPLSQCYLYKPLPSTILGFLQDFFVLFLVTSCFCRKTSFATPAAAIALAIHCLRNPPHFIISPLPFNDHISPTHAGMFESMMIFQTSRFGGILLIPSLQGSFFALEIIQKSAEPRR